MAQLRVMAEGLEWFSAVACNNEHTARCLVAGCMGHW